MEFQKLVTEELETARRKFPNINSMHEGYAILKEEVDEFWDEVKRKEPNYADMIKELVQISAMAQRTAEDLIL